jgi:ankyrin repeat protein
LLEAGSTVDTNSGPEKESILLKAVKQSHYQSTELLLKYGAKTDQDSSFDRENAVMIACVKNDLNMMKILVQASANLDTPSTIERSDQDGKYKMEIRPVFIALPNDELFEVCFIV